MRKRRRRRLGPKDEDSRATETVISENVVSAVKTKEGSACRRGVVYEIANGMTIPNLGEKQCVAESKEGTREKIIAQVADVNKGFLSVKRSWQLGTGWSWMIRAT